MPETTEFVTRDELRAELAEFKLSIERSLNQFSIDNQAELKLLRGDIQQVDSNVNKLRADMYAEFTKVHADFTKVHERISDGHKSMVRLTQFFVGATAGIAALSLGAARFLFP